MNRTPRSQTRRPIACLLVLLTLFHLPLHALTITVNKANDVYPNPLGTTLREAIEDANSGDTIVFDAALNGATITASSRGRFQIEKNLTINASALPAGITIDLNQSDDNVFEYSEFLHSFSQGSLINLTLTGSTGPAIRGTWEVTGQAPPELFDHFTTLTTLTLTDCLITDCGGIIEFPRVIDFTMNNCSVTQNHGSSSFGEDPYIFGGITDSRFDDVPGSNLHFVSCTFDNNTSTEHLFRYRNGNLTITDCSFTNNDADLFIRRLSQDNDYPDGIFTFSDSSFLHNDGQILSLTDSLGPTAPDSLIDSCTFSRNTSPGDRLLEARHSSLTVINSTFSGNTSSILIRNHDGFTNTLSNLDVKHCTFVDNVGSSLLSFPQGSGTKVPGTVRNSMFSNNTDTSGSPANLHLNMESDGWNLVDSADPAFNHPNDLTDSPANLGPLVDNGGPTLTHSPLISSAAIDAGNNAGAPPTDQRGFPRIIDSDNNGTATINIGAVESATPLTITTPIDEDNGVGSGLGTSLREAIAAASANATLIFSGSLNGLTINLDGIGAQHTQLLVDKSLTIDASTLSNGITIKASPGAFDLFRLTGNSDLHLANIDLTEGRRAVANYGSGTVSLTDGTATNFVNTSGGQPGGAFYGQGNTALTLTRCLIQNNTTSTSGGGAIYAGDNASVTVNYSCLFRNSTTGGQGGAIRIGAGAHLASTRSTFVKNRANNNGGAFFAAGTPLNRPTGTLRYTTIGENHTGAAAGAAYLTTGDFEFIHCTIFRNTGGGAFGGVPGAVRLDHTIVAENRNNAGLHFFDPPGNPISYGYNLVDVPGGFPPSHPSTDLQGVSPRLSPLGWHGGRCPTYHPLSNSPAIDRGNPAVGIFTYDQRDSLFTRDGDGNGSVIVDIGAVEAHNPTYVTTSADENGSPTPNRSLREAVANASTGNRILFDPSLNGTTLAIGPAFGEIPVGGKALLIDATNLPNGITLDCLNANRAFNILPFGGLSMHAVSITRGSTTGDGGAILNQNILSLSHGAFFANTTDGGGGAIAHNGSLLVLDHCTLTNNVASAQGGALLEQAGGALCIGHSSITHNDVLIGLGGAGGIQLTSGTGEITHTLLADNTGGQYQNFHPGSSGSLLSRGYNLETGTDAGFTAPGDIQNGSPILDSLKDNGGYSPTRANKGQGTDAGDPSFAPGNHADQRGYQRVVHGGSTTRIDIGAHEWTSSPIPDFDADGMTDAYENNNGLNPLDPEDALLDNDGDTQSNLAECLAGTDPNDPASSFRILSVFIDFDQPPGSRYAALTYPSSPGTSYHIFHSPDLSSWDLVGVDTAGAGPTSIAYVTDPGFNWHDENPGFFLMTVAP